jgi:hypothetical protein
MQELLMKHQGKTIRRPPPLQRMMMPLKMMTMSDCMEGVKFEFAVPVSQKCQLGLGWNFHTTKAPKFEYNMMLMGGTPNPMM